MPSAKLDYKGGANNLYYEDILKFLLGQQDTTIVNMLTLLVIIIFVSLFGVSLFFDFIFSMHDAVLYRRKKLFGKYMPGYSIQGEYLKNIDIKKEYIIITEDFFDDLMFKHKILYHTNLSKSKIEFLVNYGHKYNIILVARCGEYSKKFVNLIEICRFNNLPICRIIESKPSDLYCCQKTLSDGTVLIYYTREELDV